MLQVMDVYPSLFIYSLNDPPLQEHIRAGTYLIIELICTLSATKYKLSLMDRKGSHYIVYIEQTSVFWIISLPTHPYPYTAIFPEVFLTTASPMGYNR